MFGRTEALEAVEYADVWFDAWDTQAGDWPDEWVVTVVGFVVRDTPRVLSVAHEVGPEGDYRAVTHIPKVVVKRRIVLGGGGRNGSREGQRRAAVKEARQEDAR